MKIGVFDSGLGGLSVASSIRRALPKHQVVFRDDKGHVPYGSREPEEILGFIMPIFTGMIEEGCEVIVVACNTVSTTLIDELRAAFTVPLIAIEPMIKPAVEMTRTKVIAVCATPTTLKSHRYLQLKLDYASDVTVLEPDCADWSTMIEKKEVNSAIIEDRITDVLEQKADVIVLACTHYHWIEEEINDTARGRASVIQPESAIIAQLTKVLSQL